MIFVINLDGAGYPLPLAKYLKKFGKATENIKSHSDHILGNGYCRSTYSLLISR